MPTSKCSGQSTGSIGCPRSSAKRRRASSPRAYQSASRPAAAGPTPSGPCGSAAPARGGRIDPQRLVGVDRRGRGVAAPQPEVHAGEGGGGTEGGERPGAEVGSVDDEQLAGDDAQQPAADPDG